MNFRAVIFDIGGVLHQLTNPALHQQWEARLGLESGRLPDTLFINRVARRALLGQASEEDVWAEVARRLTIPADDLPALQRDFWEAYTFDPALLEFIATLRPRIRTGILSDAFPGARQRVSAILNADLFDALVFSAEEGLHKPMPEIYQRALERLEVRAPETIFIDDRPPNVEGARALGIHALRFTTSQDIRDQLRRLLNQP